MFIIFIDKLGLKYILSDMCMNLPYKQEMVIRLHEAVFRIEILIDSYWISAYLIDKWWNYEYRNIDS